MMGLINANPHSWGYEKLKERMDYHHSQGNHIILSLEAMANHLENRPETWDLFLSLFQGWNVRILVIYRHYFEWKQSLYFQQHIGKKYRFYWPEERGLIIPSFQTFLSTHLDRWERGEPSNDQYSWGQIWPCMSFSTFHNFLKMFRSLIYINRGTSRQTLSGK